MSGATVWPHDPIEVLAPNLRVVRGEIAMPIGRRMTVVRLADGRLVFHSAITLTDEAMSELEAWGEPAFLVVPNGFHRMDAPAYVARYPGLTVVCPPGATKRVAACVQVHGDYTALPEDPSLTAEVLDGSKEREGALVVRSSDGASVVLNDAVFNLPRSLPGFHGFMVRLMGSTGGPKVTRIARTFIVADRQRFADHLRRLADTEGLRRVILSHGAIVDDDPATVLRGVADALAPAAA